MQVRNPATGACEHVENNNPTIHALIRMGLLEVVTNEPGDRIQTLNGAIVPQMEPPAVPAWDVCMCRAGTAQSEFPAIVFTIGTSVYERYSGDPAEAYQGFGKRVVPKEVLKNYAYLHKQHNKKR